VQQLALLSLQATSYLNKLPAQFQPDDLVLIADPMLATGGTMMQVRAVAGCVVLV
jgi:uracil phosphoribosyltransferase